MFAPFKQLSRAIERLRAYDPDEAYLAEAVDMVDLEMRQREIDRGRNRRRYPY